MRLLGQVIKKENFRKVKLTIMEHRKAPRSRGRLILRWVVSLRMDLDKFGIMEGNREEGYEGG